MPIANSKIVYLNSHYRKDGTNSSFHYEINIPKNEAYDRVCVLQACVPLSFYLIREGQNTFVLIEDDIEHTITVPVGNYNTQNFMSTLTVLLNNHSPHNWHYLMSFSTITGKYTWLVNSNTTQPSFKFNNYYMCLQFGFDVGTTNTFTESSLTSTNIVNFIPESTIYIHSNICEGENDILQEIYSNNTSNFSQITYQLTTDVEHYSKKLRTVNSNIFKFYVTDEDNNELPTNGAPILLTLILYKKDDFTDIFKKYISWAVQKQSID